MTPDDGHKHQWERLQNYPFVWICDKCLKETYVPFRYFWKKLQDKGYLKFWRNNDKKI